MRWLLCALLLLATLDAAAARRGAGEELIRVVSPTSRDVASAHPHVNVLVAFGTAKDGSPVDPTTFRAKLNGLDVTRDFRPTFDGDVQTGLRAELPQASLRLATAPRNRLRLFIQAQKRGGAGKRARDVDRVRFGAADTPNQPPIPALAADQDIVAVGTPVTFDASGSHDPDFDELEFRWSFSDGGAATGATVAHAFAAAPDAASATVTVSDGVDEASQSMTLPAALAPDPGRTAGTLRVETKGLEFSAVATGASATRSLTVKNTDATATSQVKIHAVVQDGAGFAVAPADVDLDPDGSATIDVTFAPAAVGHASAHVMLVTSASNRAGVTFLTHGYGGAAPGDGPTLVDAPVFAALGSELDRIGSDGARVALDATTATCAPPGATFGGDLCSVDGDCRNFGELCGGAAAPIDVTDLCSDGSSLYVLSEDSFTDPRDDPETELSGSLVRFDLDAAGNVTGRDVLYRTTDDTTIVACDGLAASAGGLAYLPEFHNVLDTDACPRDERDSLVAVNKSNGSARTVSGLARMDQLAQVADCDFRDAVNAFEISPDGIAKYAGFDTRGLWRLTPTPRWITPDVRDLFQVHPDGSVTFVVGTDRGSVGSIDLYRVTADQVEHGALPLSALAPCATYTVPNNVAGAPGRTLPTSITLGPASAPATGAAVLVTFVSGPRTPATDVLPPFGDLRGTVAFSLPSGTTSCGVAGLVSLQSTPLAR